MADWRLPRMTPDLAHDWLVAARAYESAENDDQRRAVVLRTHMLIERGTTEPRATFARLAAVWAPILRDIGRTFASWAQIIAESYPQLGRGVRAEPIATVDPIVTVDPIARARRGRSSGPPPRPLDPRRRR